MLIGEVQMLFGLRGGEGLREIQRGGISMTLGLSRVRHFSRVRYVNTGRYTNRQVEIMYLVLVERLP